MVRLIVDEDLIEVERIESHLNNCSVCSIFNGVLVAVELYFSVLGEGACFIPEKHAGEGFQVVNTSVSFGERFLKSIFGGFTGSRMDSLVVHDLRPGPEGGVQFFDGMKAGMSGFILKLMFDSLIGCLDFPFRMSLIRLVTKLFGMELREDTA